MTRAKPQTQPAGDTTDLTLLSSPPDLLENVRAGNAGQIATKPLNIFYVHVDAIEKILRELKEKCRGVIIGRRNEGTPIGNFLQHREFSYSTAQGSVKLTIQERISWKPDREKLEALLKRKNLWDRAQTITLDMDKVQGLCQAHMITPEEMDEISNTPEPTYALVAKFDPTK